MAGLKYWVWLSEVKGLTNRSKLLLLDYFGTPENVYYAGRGRVPPRRGHRAAADRTARGKIVGKRRPYPRRVFAAGAAASSRCRTRTIRCACAISLSRRACFMSKASSPLSTRRSLSPWSARARPRPTASKRRRRSPTACASRAPVVISGAAAGVDSASHRGALRAGGKTIAVLGNGSTSSIRRRMRGCTAISRPRRAHQRVSARTAAEAWHFPVRNRIISGLSLATIVVEAPEKSGALITANTSA